MNELVSHLNKSDYIDIKLWLRKKKKLIVTSKVLLLDFVTQSQNLKAQAYLVPESHSCNIGLAIVRYLF